MGNTCVLQICSPSLLNNVFDRAKSFKFLIKYNLLIFFMYHTFGVRAKNLFDGDFPQQSLRLHVPNVGGLGSAPGQGTRFYMLQ